MASTKNTTFVLILAGSAFAFFGVPSILDSFKKTPELKKVEAPKVEDINKKAQNVHIIVVADSIEHIDSLEEAQNGEAEKYENIQITPSKFFQK